MKIFSAQQIRDWDEYTIRQEPVSSINLMERAARACVEWFDNNGYLSASRHFTILCGKGNNGGDGLAMARLFFQKGIQPAVYILEFGHKGTDDFQSNLEKLHLLTNDIHYIQSAEHFPGLSKNDLVIDAVFGTGLNRPVAGMTAALFDSINQSAPEVVAIDIPSGLFSDQSSKHNTVIRATHTLCFQATRMAFLVAENADKFGQLHILDIGLNKDYYERTSTDKETIGEDLIRTLYHPRNTFAHKGDFGHAAILAGSTGMMGAAVLSAKACLRSGAGKLTCYIPKSGYEIIQMAVPEAMASVSGTPDTISGFHPVAEHDAIGIGPGITTHEAIREMILRIFENPTAPLVIDADALTVMARNPELLHPIPRQTILTPHPKEFDNLFGACKDDFERINMAIQKAKEHEIIIVLKGHRTLVAMPDGLQFFNTTGNAGMATAGSGDVLTGILTGLLAQGYPATSAALLGVYLHGLAGDLAAKEKSKEAMIAGDIIDFLGSAFICISGYDFRAG
ncbi:MAG: NAD(P)H-hydrate dehydratase [Terrimonas sp.]|nr:NAD(P)H-hydrate dehydratase [Terrimonas sp.]